MKVPKYTYTLLLLEPLVVFRYQKIRGRICLLVAFFLEELGNPNWSEHRPPLFPFLKALSTQGQAQRSSPVWSCPVLVAAGARAWEIGLAR